MKGDIRAAIDHFYAHRDVHALIKKGLSLRAIAKELKLGIRTVRQLAEEL